MIEFIDVCTKSDLYGLKRLSFSIDQANIHILTVLDTGTLLDLFDVLTNRKEIESGKLLLDGKPYHQVREINYIQSGVGYVIQELSIAQNVYGLTQRNDVLYNKKKSEAKCQELINRFGFRLEAGETLINATVEERRIVELLRCYVSRPKILVLNELFDIFSFQNIAMAKELLSDMRMQGTYVIYITRKFDDVFKFGDIAIVFRDGHYVDTLDKAEIMMEPQVLYEALLGKDTILSKEQFAVGSGAFDILDVLRIGTQYMFARENISTALEKYVRVTESYFEDACCIIYIQNDDDPTHFRTAYDTAREKDELPLADSETILRLLKMDSFYTMVKANATIRAGRPDVSCDTLLFSKIIAGGQTIGVIQVSFSSLHTLTQKDIDYLHVISAEVAMMIENAKLIGRSAFLQEGHHRIKNNLQLITSMLILQKNNFRQKKTELFSLKDVEDFIDTTISRIQSIAGIHDLLSRAVVRDELITLRAILAEIQKFYTQMIQMEFYIKDDAPVPQLRATAIALVINEIISNSVKHNLGNPSLKCNLLVWMENRMILMRYQDNGRGLSPSDSGKTPGIGMAFIKTIINAELGGSFHMRNNPDADGILIDIQFPVPGLH